MWYASPQQWDNPHRKCFEAFKCTKFYLKFYLRICHAGVSGSSAVAFSSKKMGFRFSI